MQLAFGIYCLIAYKDIGSDTKMVDKYTDIFIERIRSYDPTKSLSIEVVDAIQTTFECCGANSRKDYQTLFKPLPWSCCQDVDEAAHSCKSKVYWAFGCVTKVVDGLKYNSVSIATIAISLAVLEVSLYNVSA